MWLLADAARQFNDDQFPLTESPETWIIVFFVMFAWLTSIIYSGLMIWMLFHCYRTEPDRFFWIWIMLIAQPIGAMAYFVLRYLPSKNFAAPAFFRKWTRGRELLRLETAAAQIGNPYQFIKWGDALKEVGQLDRANEAYQKALLKEGGNLQALWGSAQLAEAQKRYADVRSFTRQVLDKDAQYKFGDVSLAHAKSLNELGESESACTHLEQHARRWRHPEGMYLLAILYSQRGEPQLARQQLQELIRDIDGSPWAIAHKNGRWKSRARQLLRKLPT